MQSIEIAAHSDDGSHLKAVNTMRFTQLLCDAARSFGKDMTSVHTWKESMERTGFQNVKVTVKKVILFSTYGSHLPLSH